MADLEPLPGVKKRRRKKMARKEEDKCKYTATSDPTLPRTDLLYGLENRSMLLLVNNVMFS